MPHYGIYSHIVSEAFKLEGIKVEWGFFSWTRSLKVAENGKDWDASALWWPSDENKKTFHISEPVGTTSYVFFHLKSKDFDWNSMADLKGLKVGGTKEYEYGKEFADASKNNVFKLELVLSDDVSFKKLLHGRIDVFPNDPIVGMAQIRGLFSADQADLFTFNKKEFMVSPLCLIISKKSPDGEFFLEKFNSGLQKLKDSGRIEQMYKDLDAGKYKKQTAKWAE
jgi:polar amino acid transport system substrate-binding protein